MNYRLLFLSCILVSSLFLLETKVQSQGIDTNTLINNLINPTTGLSSEIEEQVTIEQIPKIPAPGQSVSIRLESFSTDLNKAQITWTQDGKALNSGIGVTTNIVTAPQSGQSSTIRISITKEGGGTIVRIISLNPADVDLIYEAQTYTHPFYKGKKLFTSESEILFVAIPNFINTNGQKIADSNLVYTWKINGSVQQGISGYGKNTFATKGQLIERPTTITIEVSAVNSGLMASKTIQLRSQKPEVILYENNPILGVVYEQAIQGSFVLERPQVDFEGVPYFFSANYKDEASLLYAWTINGVRSLSKSPNENYMILRNQKNEDGRALIGVQLDHANNLLQTTSSRLELNFKKVDNIENEEFVF